MALGVNRWRVLWTISVRAARPAIVAAGILAAARALKLDFVPILKERYDLVIPREHYESELLRPLLDLIRGSEFRGRVEALGGYDASQMGDLVGEL